MGKLRPRPTCNLFVPAANSPAWSKNSDQAAAPILRKRVRPKRSPARASLPLMTRLCNFRPSREARPNSYCSPSLFLQTGTGREKRRQHLINARLKFARCVRAETQEVAENGPEDQERNNAGPAHCDTGCRIPDTGQEKVTGESKFFPVSAFRFPLLSAPLAICRSHLTQKFKFIETFARSFRHGAQRICRNMDRQTSFLAQK